MVQSGGGQITAKAKKGKKQMSASNQDLETVQDIIIEQLGVSREQLTPEAELMRDLGADSLDVIEIGMSLETEFNMTISDQQSENIRTVSDVYEAVENRKR